MNPVPEHPWIFVLDFCEKETYLPGYDGGKKKSANNYPKKFSLTQKGIFAKIPPSLCTSTTHRASSESSRRKVRLASTFPFPPPPPTPIIFHPFWAKEDKEGGRGGKEIGKWMGWGMEGWKAAYARVGGGGDHLRQPKLTEYYPLH